VQKDKIGKPRIFSSNFCQQIAPGNSRLRAEFGGLRRSKTAERLTTRLSISGVSGDRQSGSDPYLRSFS
jgi:hypothetical protein